LSRLPSAAPLRASSLPDALPILVRGRAPAGGELPGPAAGPELTGPAVLSSLRSVADGGADRLEARLVSMSAAEQDVRLTAPGASPGPGASQGSAGSGWQVTDLRGQPTGADVRSPLRAGEVRTLRAG